MTWKETRDNLNKIKSISSFLVTTSIPMWWISWAQCVVDNWSHFAESVASYDLHDNILLNSTVIMVASQRTC